MINPSPECFGHFGDRIPLLFTTFWLVPNRREQVAINCLDIIYMITLEVQGKTMNETKNREENHQVDNFS